jgi:hypothetical protein
MTTYMISKDGINLWSGDYASEQEALAAFIKDLGSEALDYDAVDSNWIDDLQIDEA